MDQAGLRAMGLFQLRSQQFIAAAATVAIINSVVGGALVALIFERVFGLEVWATMLIGAVVALLLAVAFLRYQWRAWSRVAAALPLGSS